MRTWSRRAAWISATAAACIAALALANAAFGGDLDPPGPVGPSMRRIDEVLPSWSRDYQATDGVDSCSSSRFRCVLNVQGVLDLETGLVWQRVAPSTAVTWAGARNLCRAESTGGRFGWRLPAIAELSSLVDPNGFGSMPPEGHPFLGMNPADSWSFWTSEREPGAGAAIVAFGNQSLAVSPWDVSNTARYWCVRGPGTGPGTSSVP